MSQRRVSGKRPVILHWAISLLELPAIGFNTPFEPKDAPQKALWHNGVDSKSNFSINESAVAA
jgi:hypothetical protein